MAEEETQTVETEEAAPAEKESYNGRARHIR